MGVGLGAGTNNVISDNFKRRFLAFRYNITDFAMIYYIQKLSELTTKVDRLEKMAEEIKQDENLNGKSIMMPEPQLMLTSGQTMSQTQPPYIGGAYNAQGYNHNYPGYGI